MIDLNNFCPDEITHELCSVFAFVTDGPYGQDHLYVVGLENTIIDLSHSSHAEYRGYKSVEDFAMVKGETIQKIYKEFSDFKLKLIDT